MRVTVTSGQSAATYTLPAASVVQVRNRSTSSGPVVTYAPLADGISTVPPADANAANYQEIPAGEATFFKFKQSGVPVVYIDDTGFAATVDIAILSSNKIP